MLRLLLLCMLSFGYTNQINNVSGNIEQFSLMNGNSFIHNIVNDIDTNLYSISFIQYPGHISSGQLLYLEKYKQYFIQSKISTINYGLLRDNDNEFSASDYMIQIAIIKQHSNNFMVGSSVGYAKSHIAHYTSSQLIQDIGFSYSYFNDLVIICFSIENMTHIINEYSNMTSQYTHYNNLSCQLNPRYINASLFINYIFYNVAGFSEFDTFRSQQIRAGLIDRDTALNLAHKDNQYDMATLKEFMGQVGLNLEEVLTRIGEIPKLS